jgi:DNA primase
LIKRTSIEGLKAHADLYQLVSDYASLQRSGGAWKGLSPFTQEKTPSFFVYPDRGFFYCFSTSQGGDAIKFLQLKENLTFTEAVEALADRFNFKLEYESNHGEGSLQRSGSSLKLQKELHEAATAYFQKALNTDRDESNAARKYFLEGRGFTTDHVNEYRIGYAPVDSGVLFHYLKKLGFSESDMETSGLFFPRGQSKRSALTPRFRGRLMIPICDLMGNPIAFTARKLEVTPRDDPAFEAKYVNSPTTPLFNKGTLLFGIHIARKAVGDDRPFVMVEGQLDAIRCWTEGFQEVVATQGTAITEIQLGKLKNYCPSLIMCLDGDSAGSKAAMRVLPMALATGLDVRFIQLPQGDDPDTLLRNHGAETFRKRLNEATPAVPFLVDQFFHQDRRDPASLARAAEHCFEMIVKSPSRILRNKMVEDIAYLAQLDVQLLRSDFETYARKDSRRRQSSVSTDQMPKKDVQRSKLRTIEADLLQLVLEFETVRQKVNQLDFSDLIDSSSLEGALLIRICAEIGENPGWSPEDADAVILESDEERNLYFHTLTQSSKDSSPLESLDVCLKTLQHRWDSRRLKEIDRSLNRSHSLDTETINQLFQEKAEIKNRAAKGG